MNTKTVICCDCGKTFGYFGNDVEKRHFKLNNGFLPIRCHNCQK